MRRNIIIIQTILLIISFFFMAKGFDQKSNHRCTEVYYNEVNYNNYQIWLTIDDTITLNTNEVSKYIDLLANENNLVVSKLQVNFRGLDNIPDNILYYSSNSKYLENRIFVKNGKFISGKRYSTFPTDGEEQIIKFFDDRYSSVLPLSDDNNPGGIYVLMNIEGDYDKNVDNLSSSLQLKYPDIFMTVQRSGYYNQDTNDLDYIFDAKKIKLAFCIIIMLALISAIFSRRTQISIMKMEGYSIKEIYFYFFLKHYLFYAIPIILLIVLLSVALVGFSTLGLVYIIKMWIMHYIFLFTILGLLSFSLYFIIETIPITTSIKGQSNLREMQIFSSFIKFIICLLVIPNISTGLSSSLEIFKLSNRHSDIQKMSENIYTFGLNRVSNYAQDIGSENAIRLYNDMISTLDMFEMSEGFIPLSTDYSKLLEVVFVDDLFISKNELVSNYDKNKYMILLNVNEKFDKAKIIESLANEYNINSSEIQINYYDKKINAFGFHSLRNSNYLIDKPLIYIPVEEQFKGQFSSKYIYYENTLESLQEIIDSKFRQYGYLPQFEMTSLKITNERSYSSIMYYLYEQLKPFIIFSFIYIFTALFMIQVHKVSNKNLYFITKCEGISLIYVREYFIYYILPVIIALLFRGISINISFDIIGYFITFELLFYFITKRVMENRFWRK